MGARCRDFARAGLETCGCAMLGCILERDVQGHVPAFLPRGSGVEQLAFAEQRTDACGTNTL